MSGSHSLHTSDVPGTSPEAGAGITGPHREGIVSEPPFHAEESGVTEREIDPGTTEARLKRWINSVGTVTLPLLAGFSFTSVVVVSDDAAHFQWPGLTILFLAFAALALIAAVQCAYHAQIYLPDKDPNYDKGLDWAWRTRVLYDLGLLAMLAGLGLVVVPHHAAGIQAAFQWAAFILICIIFLVEVEWKRREGWPRPR